ncbi:DMT family protein [Xanthomonas campestris]|uniref:DMT family protein n=1 Tax=Xanthomonas campestris TaxID=339 RepID=UPI002B237D03|nr:DMT family protein [Xanthomonas campestris]MEA9480861.1 DMT family protein [Xanthomonas campestris]
MPTAPFTAYLYPILLLLASNVFMTFAWYGHLKYKSTPLMIAILVSWGIAFFEYCLQVPGNRLGSAVYSAPQLKGMQEVITLLVFAGFSTFYLGQSLKWNHWTAFGLILVAAFLMFKE